MPTISKRYFWIIFIVLLAACSPGAATAKPTEVDVNAVSTLAAMTVVARMTQTGAPTETASSMPYPTGTVTRTPMPTLTPLPFAVLEGLRMAYITKGNLYIQDSGDQPVQLTNSGQDHSPIFSDDGQKIVFNRGNPNHHTYEVYMINADGSGERALVTNNLLLALGLGYDEAAEPVNLAFVPSTHQLLFSTEQFPPSALRGGDMRLKSNDDLLLVDADTGQIKQILSFGRGGYFQVSPNGKLVWILTADRIDVIDLNGKIVRHNLTAYPSTWPGTSTPFIFWRQDSNKLYAIPPGKLGVPEPDTIWQYPLNGSPAVETHFSPPPMSFYFSISPDGNWVVYTFTDPAKLTHETATQGIYLGNLRNGTSKLVYTPTSDDLPFYYYWNPDSAHFIFEDYKDQMFMGNVDGGITPLHRWRFFEWIDNSHYLYAGVAMGEIDKEAGVKVAELPAGVEYFNFFYVKPEQQIKK